MGIGTSIAPCRSCPAGASDSAVAIGAATNRHGRTPSPSALHRIRATLRSVLNAAIREGLLRDNPARYVEVPSPRRPHALVWTAFVARGIASSATARGRVVPGCGRRMVDR
jgi:hypothetical protein